MTSRRHPNDDYAIPGGSIGAETTEGIVLIPASKNKSLLGLLSRTIQIIDWNLSTRTDTISSPKYRSNPDVSYYADGTISVSSQKGKMSFCKDVNDPSDPAFGVDQEDSRLYSSCASTTLGSSLIDTIDGLLMNPQGSVFPSSGFSPTKTWIPQLFPSFGTKNVVVLSILQLVQIGLLELAKQNKNSTNINERTEERDLGTIIIEYEDRFFK